MAFHDPQKWRRRAFMLKALGPRRFFYTLAPLVLAFAVVWGCGAGDASIRWSGMVLQILGVLTVVRGLNDTRREFGLPAVHSDLASWFTRFMKAEPHVINVDAIMAGVSLMRGRLSSAMPPLPETATLEQRIVRLERGLEVALSEAEQMNQTRDKEIAQLEDQVKAERNLRASAIEKVERQLQQVSTGGVWISLMGTVWLLVGVVLGSIAPEVNAWFGKS